MTKSLAQMEESARHQSVHELKKVLGPALLTVVRTPGCEAAPLLVSTVQCDCKHRYDGSNLAEPLQIPTSLSCKLW